MAEDTLLNQTVPDKRTAKKLARTLGCEGAHKAPGAESDGWHPCESAEALKTLIEKGMKGYRAWKLRSEGTKSRIVVMLPEEKKKRSERKRMFRKRRIVGINTLPSGGLASAPYSR